MGHEDRVVFADGGFGAGDDEDLAAPQDAVEVEWYGVAQQRVDLVRGDEPLDLVAGRVERLCGVAAVGGQCWELALPVALGDWASLRSCSALTTLARYLELPIPSMR